MKISLTLAAVFLISVSASQAQFKDPFGTTDLSSLKGELKTPQVKMDTRQAVPLDAPVDPAEYSVGPGDQLGVSIWSSAPLEYQLMITPEASLLIPTVGVIDVRGLTLEQVKKKVAQAASRRYVNADISVTLLVPRKVAVSISGFVLDEGKKETYAVERVDDLIALSNKFPSERLTVDEYAQQLLQLRRGTSDRHIVVRRRDGSMRHVDLVRYRITGEGKYNPYLSEGDNVYVPERKDVNNTIAVFGARMAGAEFEFVPGDSLSRLVSMALGFSETADPEHAYLSRLSVDGQRMDTLRIDARAIAEGKAKDIALQPGDRLVIPQRPEMRQNYRVHIDGAVRWPGTYPITLGSTRLSEAIRNAGGLTTLANLKGASLLRYPLPDAPSSDMLLTEQLLSRRTALSLEDSSYYYAETTLRLKREEVSVDFYRLFAEGDSTQDVVLRSNDQIEIPPHTRTIYVFGQVVNPGHVDFVQGEGYTYYVEKAGGFTNDARSADTKVIKSRTHVWLDPGETTMEDGDLLWVPKEVTYPTAHYITSWAQIFGIIGVVATVALLVQSF